MLKHNCYLLLLFHKKISIFKIRIKNEKCRKKGFLKFYGFLNVFFCYKYRNNSLTIFTFNSTIYTPISNYAIFPLKFIFGIMHNKYNLIALKAIKKTRNKYIINIGGIIPPVFTNIMHLFCDKSICCERGWRFKRSVCSIFAVPA